LRGGVDGCESVSANYKMTKKNKLDEHQIWAMVMMILPVVILMNAGNELTDDSGMQVVYAGVFGGLGGLIGFAASYLTKDKNRVAKIFATVSLITISGLIIYLLSSKSTDTDILKQEWITQKIGEIEFDSPTKLELQTSEIPESVKWFYSEMNLYSDQGSERITLFLQTKILIDTLSIENAYSGALEEMIKRIKVSMEDVALEVFGVDEEEVSSMFSFNINGLRVNGYGYMYMNANTLESIWLMPLKRGFSKDYIEEFETRIIPDYEKKGTNKKGSKRDGAQRRS